MINNDNEQWQGSYINNISGFNADDYIMTPSALNPFIRTSSSSRETINPNLDNYIKYAISSHLNAALKDIKIQDRCLTLEIEYKNMNENIKELKSDLNDFKTRIDNKFETIAKNKKEDWRFWLMFVVALIAAIFAAFSYFKGPSPEENKIQNSQRI